MFSEKKIESDLLALEGVVKGYPFGKKLAAFSFNGQTFALLHEDTEPIQLSLRCDAQLAELLREKYETIMPTQKMDSRFWNTLVLSGQLAEDEVKDLIRHAYELSKETID